MKILFFASLRERLATGEEIWDELDGIATVADVLEKLKRRPSPWPEALQGKVMMAVNQEMANADTPVSENDEVAFFPPVTGG